MRKPLWTYLACCIAVFMVAMDNLIVTNALPVIRQALHTGPEGLEWTVNAYTLTFAVLLLTGAAPRAATFHAVSIGPAPAFLSRPLPLGHDLTGKEGIMPTSSIPTCTLCGLRFANRPLLEWHIREDHNRRPEPKERPSGAPPDDEAAAS